MPPTHRPRRRRSPERVWKLARDVTLTLTGILVLAHEVYEQSPDPVLVGAALALCGVAYWLRRDERSGPP